MSEVVSGRYRYKHDSRWPVEAIDVHNVVVEKSKARVFFAFLFLLILASLFLAKDLSMYSLVLSISSCVLLFKLMWSKRAVKESVIVIPTFGVQLETHYQSGRVIRRFVPVGKILKPVLLECVTPVTCYWSLSLILEGEAELMLVFKEFHPPLKILVAIWKAVRIVVDNEEASN